MTDLRQRLRKIASHTMGLALATLLLALPLHAAAAELPDDTVQDIVETRLQQRALAPTKVSVSVDDGVVTLTGTVDTLAEKRQAEKLATKADGVQRVINDLQLATVDRTNAQLARSISQAIDNYVFYTVFDWIEGNVEDGRVMLEGFVTEPWKKQDLVKSIEAIPGVHAVESSVKVLSPVDDDLRLSLARQIYGDLTFLGRASGEDQPIHIVVHDGGDVVLEGVVRNQVEKRVAETIARTHPWTFSVDNNLITRSSVGNSGASNAGR